MIDHMLVNLKKYYEGKFPCYIGFNIQAPKNNLPAYYIAENPVDGTDMLPSTAKPSLTPAELENKEVIAQRLNGLDDFYLLIQPAGYYSYINCWIKLSDLVKNGGVSHSPLTHVCHALILVRKEISMALMKMKYQLNDWYQGITQNYIGRSVTLPKTKIRLYDIQNTNYLASGAYTDCQNGKLLGTAGTIAGQAVVDGETLVSISWPFQFDYDNVDYTYVKLSDILQNGGGIR